MLLRRGTTLPATTVTSLSMASTTGMLPSGSHPASGTTHSRVRVSNRAPIKTFFSLTIVPSLSWQTIEFS